jgi:U3 small nucleolar RNA-associated protein 25
VGDGSDVPQDQGFTRPKLLLLLPLRSVALRWARRLLELLPAAQGRADAVSKRERLESEYGPRPDEVGGAAARSVRGKPPDFAALFDGNRDDHFRLGAKLTRASVRLFTDFAGSDIIMASPLGLATRLAAGGADFLSSVELVVADGLDVALMQNWAHVESVFGALNGLPAAPDGAADVMRVRPWYLNGWARHYRQSVLLSRSPSPQLAALARVRCANAAGGARLRPCYGGALGACAARATHDFSRVAAEDAAGAADARFRAFVARILPLLRDGAGGDLLFVPSYFDYVRLRNFLRSQDASFVSNCEYSDASHVGRARASFSGHNARIMLYTERAHFFRRHSIRGARRLTFYGPPETASFYSELVNALEPPAGGQLAEVALLFTRWDALALERLVGSARAQRMLRGTDTQFLFC